MKTASYIFLAVIILVYYGCKENNDFQPNSNVPVDDPWLVPKNEIIHWDAEKDKIKSLDSTTFIPNHLSHLNDNEMVFAYHYQGETRIYPVSVLGTHEIVNDQLDDQYFAVTYCPLTASAIAWNRVISGTISSYGVSGKLYNNNLIPYDRLTGSHWSQMKNLCINGEQIGEEPETFQLIETRYSTIKAAFPEAVVLSHDSCDTGVCELKQGNDDVDPSDDSVILPPEARYFGITKNQKLLLFELELFNDSYKIYQTRFDNMNLVVVGNNDLPYYAAFIYSKQDQNHSFYPVEKALPIIMQDDKGNTYDMFGNIVDGPDKGIRLQAATSYLALTYAWQEIFDDISLFDIN